MLMDILKAWIPPIGWVNNRLTDTTKKELGLREECNQRTHAVPRNHCRSPATD
jgi:hypothetical protein